MKLIFKQIKFHRNGTTGEPFHVIRFTDSDEGEDNDMIAVVFQAEWHVAVLDLDRLAVGDIGFDRNCWRGDLYEPHLRRALKQLESERISS